MSDSSLVPAEKMRALTGLTDKQLRGLAAKGFFPAPARGQYQFIPSLIGLFRFYRESQAGGPEEIYYDSMASCSAQLEISLEILKSAKRRGCPAFKASRVYLLPLIKWLGAKPEDGEGSTNYAAEKMKWSAKREKVKFLKEDNKAADWGEIAHGLNSGMALLNAILERQFAQSLPRDLKGLSELAIKKRLTAELEKAMVVFRARVSELGNLDPKPAAD